MEYIYAALLLHKLGKPVSEESLKKVIAATDTQVDEAKVKVLIESLRDVDIEKELESATLAAAAPSASAGEGSGEVKAEEKEEKEEKPEAAAEGLSALFG